MKKKWFLFTVASLLLVSCKSSDEVKPDDGTGTPSWTTYEVLDTKAELGFYMLDRNVGATEKYNSKAPSKAAIGNYYQWGKNTPVKISADSSSITNYDKEWNAPSASAKDWSKAENTPCPCGWRIPNLVEMKKITAAAWADYDGLTDQTEAEFNAAKALYSKLALARTGYIRIVGADSTARAAAKVGVYLPKAAYIWSAALNPDTPTSSRAFKYAYTLSDNYDIMLGKKGNENEVNVAMPIRCIKD
ncbi:FISUMP domain-containing protein [Paludibacter propionicigenes]|uniref:FISUMP domain-containing protein n=1 Tax=Paludibacter propionicigenes TaxID=185300 RepID=UPI0002EC1CEB|nr:FISUMP domain-containing protein [Paludibacter propionicigenes]